MNKIFLILFLFFLPALSYAQPSIVFEEEKYDFGTIEKGDAIEHTFNIANAGDQDLVIEKIIPS